MPASVGVTDIVEQITDEHQQWSEMLRSFDQDDWGRASACAGWTVKHVVAHVVTGIEFYRDSLENALHREAEPLWEDPRAGRQALFERALGLGDADLVDAFDEASNVLDKTLMKFSDEDADGPAWHPAGVWTVERMLFARLNDSTLHHWDIQRGFEPWPAIDLERLPFLVRNALSGIARYVDPNSGTGRPGRWRFDLVAPIGEPALVAVQDGLASGTLGGDPPADNRCEADAAAFVLFIAKRATPEEAAAHGALRNVSDQAAFADLYSRVRSI